MNKTQGWGPWESCPPSGSVCLQENPTVLAGWGAELGETAPAWGWLMSHGEAWVGDPSRPSSSAQLWSGAAFLSEVSRGLWPTYKGFCQHVAFKLTLTQALRDLRQISRRGPAVPGREQTSAQTAPGASRTTNPFKASKPWRKLCEEVMNPLFPIWENPRLPPYCREPRAWTEKVCLEGHWGVETF